MALQSAASPCHAASHACACSSGILPGRGLACPCVSLPPAAACWLQPGLPELVPTAAWFLS